MNDREDAAEVAFFPPAIPLIAIFLGVLLEWIFPLSGYFPIESPARVVIGASLALISVLLLGLWSVVLFRSGGQSENPWKPTTHIEERGPYRFTRNPMYLQMALVCTGVGIALANWWVLVLVPAVMWALYTLVIRHEERYLEAKFGESYLAYKRRVRRWI
ncbi:methyltransferase family protein [Lentisalinibacter salinarum]|uniref:methyltransferase family protein n=1 Tax=Lentisalinibacter salinarum TaxID=2992239 RepID=UPI00386FAD89